MSNEAIQLPRRRPVDMLFGEEVELKPKPNPGSADARPGSSSGYMVEPPRPVTTVRPPPVELPTEWSVPSPPTVVVPLPLETPVAAEPVAAPPAPVNAPPPAVVSEPVPEAVTFTLPAEDKPRTYIEPPMPVFVAPAVKTAAAAPAPVTTTPPAVYGQTDLVELSQFVDQLYQNVADETTDSAPLNAECLAQLSIARAAIEKREYGRAETAAEHVKARLLQARASRAAAALPATRGIMAWLGVAAALGIVLFAIPFVFHLVPAVVPLLRGVGLGMLGGAAAALWQMNRDISRRQFDGVQGISFALSPVYGALLGGILYLLSLLGVLAAPAALGITFEPFLLMYLFALLAGVFNDAIVSGVRSLAYRMTKKPA